MTLRADVTATRDAFELRAALAIEPGETVALLGPNGAGKSTLVDVLAGLVRPRSGRVELDGAALDDVDRSVHVPASERRVGVAFQGGCLFPHLSALENVAFPLRARGVPTGVARERARAALAGIGADRLAAHKPGTLSGGEAQRVALARALIGDPRLLLLDEPLAALDVTARSAVRAELRSILGAFEGVAIFVTHEPVDAMTLADRLVILEGGRVTQSGAPEEIRRAPRTLYAADLAGVNLFAGRLESLPDGTALLRTDDGDIACMMDPAVEPGGRALGILRPADVSLYRERPEGSARNVFTGVILSVSLEGDRARVVVGSAPRLVAEITSASLRGMGLSEGVRVWTSFKALEVRVVPA